jgi:hypothetical protein
LEEAKTQKMSSKQVSPTKNNCVGREMSWGNQCIYPCQMCNAKVNTEYKLSKHAEDYHGISMLLYKKNLGTPSPTIRYHQCLLCPTQVRFERSFITRHLGSFHDEYSLDAYIKELVHDPGDGAIADLSTPDKTLKKTRMGKQIRNQWANHCIFTCPLCKTVFFSYQGLFQHTSKIHGGTPRDLGAVVGSKFRKIVHHNCLLCGKQVQLSSEKMSTHMKHVHGGLKLSDYKRDYVDEEET